jgi:hypothetical protein
MGTTTTPTDGGARAGDTRQRWMTRRRAIKLIVVGVIAVGLFRTRGMGFRPVDADVKGTTQLPRIPQFTSEALDGKSWTFPNDLNKPWTLIAMAFTQDQQTQVDTWVPAVDVLLEERNDLAFFEWPTLSNKGYYDNVVFRKTLASGMRSGIESPIARARTVTTYVKVDAFLAEMGLSGTQTIHVILVDKSGTVKWHTTGLMSPKAIDELTQALK